LAKSEKDLKAQTLQLISGEKQIFIADSIFFSDKQMLKSSTGFFQTILKHKIDSPGIFNN
jgi:hypothetical protein